MKKKETIIQLLMQKPWDPAQAKIDNTHDGETLNLSKGKLGLRYLMIVSTIFFSLFIVTYSSCFFLMAIMFIILHAKLGSSYRGSLLPFFPSSLRAIFGPKQEIKLAILAGARVPGSRQLRSRTL